MKAHYTPFTWTFFRATDVLSNRYLARYTSLNWPRPIFFSIWKFASELWPISGCNGFWKIKKTTQLSFVRIHIYSYVQYMSMTYTVFVHHTVYVVSKTLVTWCNGRMDVTRWFNPASQIDANSIVSHLSKQMWNIVKGSPFVPKLWPGITARKFMKKIMSQRSWPLI